MATGKLKMWNAERGYGFIGDDAGGPDVFLHISPLESAGIDPDNIRKGERPTVDVESTRDGKTRAANVRRAGRSRSDILTAVHHRGTTWAPWEEQVLLARRK